MTVMGPWLRKFVLTAHVIFSVGWFGSVAAFLSLAIVGLTSGDARMVGGTCVAMGVVTWWQSCRSV
jgi:hypothetical protein